MRTCKTLSVGVQRGEKRKEKKQKEEEEEKEGLSFIKRKRVSILKFTKPPICIDLSSDRLQPNDAILQIHERWCIKCNSYLVSFLDPLFLKFCVKQKIPKL